MSFLYRIFYLPFLNVIFRNVLTLLNQLFGTKWRISLSGKISFRVKNKHFYLEMNESSPMAGVYWNNPNAFEFTPLFASLIQQVKGFMDIGANLGYYSFLGTAFNPDLKVISFEPSNGPWHYLQKNKSHNKGLVDLHKIALSEQVGEIEFFEEFNPKYPYLKHHLSGMSTTFGNEMMKKSVSYKVKTLTLDAFYEANPFASLDLIKIDTEGTEDAVFRGGKAVIAKFLPIIICEILNAQNGKAIGAIFRELPYSFFQYKQGKLFAVEVLLGGDDEETRNFFFVPNAKIDLLKEWIVKS